MSQFFILRGASGDEFCRVWERPDGIRSMRPAKRGTSMLDRWSDDVSFAVAGRHPGQKVPDAIKNAQECLMVSDRLKALVEENVVSPVEFLPFTLLNHKGRVASDSMWVVNLLDTVACADMDATKGSMSPFHEGEIQDLVELHVIEDRVPDDRKIFRVAEHPATFLVRDDLRAAIDEAGMTVTYHALGAPIL
jgi:hypothetical protein